MAFEQLINELNRLQRRIYESYREFNTTQDNLDSKELIEFFIQQAAQRKEYYAAIRETIKDHGEIPANVTRPFSDAADEIFTDLKTFFSAEDDKMILQEAKQVEQRLLASYDQVLAVASVSPSLEKLLTEQRDEVARDHKEISDALDKVS
ncbi:MAG: DUF2383 domain-containing protein [Saprospiraceae bacterium]